MVKLNKLVGRRIGVYVGGYSQNGDFSEIYLLQGRVDLEVGERSRDKREYYLTTPNGRIPLRRYSDKGNSSLRGFDNGNKIGIDIDLLTDKEWRVVERTALKVKPSSNKNGKRGPYEIRARKTARILFS